MIGSICFYCDEVIESNPENPCQTYRMIPLERPYANIFLHVPCLEEVKKTGVEQYLNDNYDRIGPYNCGVGKRTRKNSKSETNKNSEDKGELENEDVSTEDE